MSKHTPGPWYVGREDQNTGEIEVVSEDRPYICLVFPGAIDEVTPANARLIAAAPELLEALIGFMNEFGDKSINNKNVWNARSAIAKATGK